MMKRIRNRRYPLPFPDRAGKVSLGATPAERGLRNDGLL
jgi:hypothetical protein